MGDHQYFVVDGPFAGEVCALELGRHVNEIALQVDEGGAAIYRVDGYASLVFVGIDSHSVGMTSRAA